MYYHGKDKQTAESITDKVKLLAALNDENWVFTKEELERIIHDEFFIDENQMNMEVIDAALARIMKLNGEEINGTTLHANREKMMRKVFAEILGVKQQEEE